MATVKHIKVKNIWYADAVSYLKYQHDEFTNQPLVDADGRMILRESFLMDGILCNPVSFGQECMSTNTFFGKNNSSGEIKAHHYIVSFDPRDKTDNALTPEKAHALGMEIAQRAFPGHQTIVCTHPDGHNSAGNIHVHIVINSVRKESVADPEFVERSSDVDAGKKHNASAAFMGFFKQLVMDVCQREQLYQVDLLSPAKVRISDKEYWAQRRGQHLIDETPATGQTSGQGKPLTAFETTLGCLRKQIVSALEDSISFEEFREELLARYGIEVYESRGRLSYHIPDRLSSISARKLGTDFDRPFITDYFAQKYARTQKNAHEHGLLNAIDLSKSIRLVADLQTLIKAQSNPYYARKVKITNLQELSKTVAFLQENKLETMEDLDSLISASNLDVQQAHDALKELEANLRSTNLRIRYVGQYLGNKKVYSSYLKASNQKQYRMEHQSELALFETAREKLFELDGSKTIPKLSDLKEEKAKLLSQKNELYESYSSARSRQKKLAIIKQNTAVISQNNKPAIEKMVIEP